LIQEAEAVLVIASRAYITSATDNPTGKIAAEVQEIYSKNTATKRVPIVVLAVDSPDILKDMPGWSWSKLNSKWRVGPPILFGPLRHAGETKLRDAVKAAILDLNKAMTGD